MKKNMGRGAGGVFSKCLRPWRAFGPQRVAQNIKMGGTVYAGENAREVGDRKLAVARIFIRVAGPQIKALWAMLRHALLKDKLAGGEREVKRGGGKNKRDLRGNREKRRLQPGRKRVTGRRKNRGPQ